MSSETPEHWTKEFILSDGTNVLVRPEKPSDVEMLKGMFLTLSDKTLRFYDRQFSEEVIENWVTNLNYDKALPIVAVTIDYSRMERIISVASLNFESSQAFKHKSEFAITVHDDYQNRGLGSIMTNHMVEIARRKGIKKVYLKVAADNPRAIHVYEKNGFHIEGKLIMETWSHITGEYIDDYRMALFL